MDRTLTLRTERPPSRGLEAGALNEYIRENAPMSVIPKGTATRQSFITLDCFIDP